MSNKRILIKYGGNAMRNPSLQTEIIAQIRKIRNDGTEVILVHGGGPFIQELLDEVGMKSDFIEGHRYTSEKMLPYVEMALKGRVNGDLIGQCIAAGIPAVGLSGKDAQTVTAEKRFHYSTSNGQREKMDLGRVGNVKSINNKLPELLLKEGIMPVFTCVAADENGQAYNINADMFAGHLAGALNVDAYIVLTDVDGLMKDIHQPESLIPLLSAQEVPELNGSLIKGGMIPKTESCVIALEKGAKTAWILNGTKPEQLEKAFIKHEQIGTKINLS